LGGNVDEGIGEEMGAGVENASAEKITSSRRISMLLYTIIIVACTTSM